MEWKESEHPRDDEGKFVEKEKAGKLLGVDLTNNKHIDTSTTGMSYYDNLIPGSEEYEFMKTKKNRIGDIVEMSPKEYFNECAEKIFNNTFVDLLEGRRIDQPERTEELKKVERFKMPMIDYADKGQEGLHRMMILGDKYGWDTKFPVLKVDVFDDKVEEQKNIRKDEMKLENALRDYDKYFNTFENIDELEYFLESSVKDDNVKYKIDKENNKIIFTYNKAKIEKDLPDYFYDEYDDLKEMF